MVSNETTTLQNIILLPIDGLINRCSPKAEQKPLNAVQSLSLAELWRAN